MSDREIERRLRDQIADLQAEVARLTTALREAEYEHQRLRIDVGQALDARNKLEADLTTAREAQQQAERERSNWEAAYVSKVSELGTALHKLETERTAHASTIRKFKTTCELSDRVTNQALKAQATVAQLRTALTAILAEPYGCRFCDSGKLRNPSKEHDDGCGYHMAAEVLAAVHWCRPSETGGVDV